MAALLPMLLTACLCFFCAFGGYAACYHVSRYQQRQRARAVDALGGLRPLPDWELDARRLEKLALRRHRSFFTISPHEDARELRGAADIVRERGRKRDQEWNGR